MKILISESQLGHLLFESFRVVPIDFENDMEDDIDIYDVSEKVHRIAKDNGVNILRGKELKSVVLDENDNVLGGLWTEISGDEFSFDIAIDKSYQGMGIGERLVREAFSEFNLQNYDDELRYVVDVTNPVMEKILLKYGFVVDKRVMGHVIMVHPTNRPRK